MIDPVGGEPRELGQGRQIRFVVTPTGVRVAYAIVGRGPALVVPAAWVGHLEIAWQDPAVRSFSAPIAAMKSGNFSRSRITPHVSIALTAIQWPNPPPRKPLPAVCENAAPHSAAPNKPC